MSSAADLARRYLEAIAAYDLDAATAMWAPGGVERVVGQRELPAPEGVREFQEELHGAFPDLRWEVLEVIAEGERAVVRNQDTEQARESIGKLAALDPASVWAGHADPVTGDVRAQLERAASVA